MSQLKLDEKRIECRSLACKASRYFYMGDLPTARFFFVVLKEVVEEIVALERQLDAERGKRARLLAPRKPWFERS